MINSLLYSIQNLITLSPTEIGIVTSLFKEKTYKKGDFFLEEGRICKQVGFVAKGLMRYYINHDGEEKTYAFSQENDYVCNYESFLPQSPSSKIIQALEDSDVLVISRADKNFEKSLFILKGLANDGLASDAGTPRKFSDLATFVYLNNSRLVGFQKLAAPVFDFFAKAAIKNGHLTELIQKYCK